MYTVYRNTDNEHVQGKVTCYSYLWHWIEPTVQLTYKLIDLKDSWFSYKWHTKKKSVISNYRPLSINHQETLHVCLPMYRKEV